MLAFRRHRLPSLLFTLLLAVLSLPSPAAASGQDDLASSVRGPATAAPSASSQPMVVVRMRGKDLCGKRCPEWIVARGTITPGTPALFRRLLTGLGGAKLPVVLDSEGGDIGAAVEIGRMIRARGLTTIIGRSEAQGCGPHGGTCRNGQTAGLPVMGYVVPTGTCARACLLVLAAGTQRIGYWMGGAPFLEADAAAGVAGYLADMGISPGLLPRLRRSDLPLDRAELLHFGFSTGRQRVEDFTGSSICLRPDPAPNCMRLAKTAPPGRISARPQARTPMVPRSTGVIIWGGIEDM